MVAEPAVNLPIVVPKSLGQLAFEFMIDRSFLLMQNEGFGIGELRWDDQTPALQKDWDDLANYVVLEFLNRQKAGLTN